MSDEYTWSSPHSIQRNAIEDFLKRAEDRIDKAPNRVPVRATTAYLVIDWLRARLDVKPSQET